MKRTAVILGWGLLAGWSPALAADRLTDRDVKALVARIEEGRDRFDDALDDKVKRSVVRGASGEVNVSSFLDDFQENIDRLEERLRPEYAGSAEAGALLRQASVIERFFKQQPPGTRGESEWNRLATALNALANAYGTRFPLTENATVRRIGDRELAAMTDDVARTADRLKKSLDTDLKKDTAVDKAARQAIVADANELGKDARVLRDKVEDGEVSSAEAERLLVRAAKLQAFIESHQVPASASVWIAAAPRLQGVASAYNAPWPGSR